MTTQTFTLQERERLEELFFSKRITISYSAMTRLVRCPSLYYEKYILGMQEADAGLYASEGKLLHCLLLNPQDFGQNYLVTPAQLPTEKVIQVLNTLLLNLQKSGKFSPDKSLEDYPEEILKALSANELYQNMSEKVQLSKILAERNQQYWQFLADKQKNHKEIISLEQLKDVNLIVDKIQGNDSIMEIMGINGGYPRKIELKNELFLKAALPERMFDIKGIIDNLVINHEEKMIYINDLKKSAKDLLSFSYSIQKYRYDIQAALYHLLVERELVYQKYPDYEIVFRFIVIDDQYQMAPVRISDTTMGDWRFKLEQEFDMVSYHLRTRRFDLPYSVASHNNEIVL